MPTITIYSTPACTYCKMAKQYLTANNIAFTEKDVALDPVAMEEMLKKTGQMGVPVIDVNGNIVIGFDREELAKLLNLPV